MSELDMETVLYMFGYTDAFSVGRIVQTISDMDEVDLHTLWLIACTMHERYGDYEEQLNYIEMKMAEGEEE
tara:strand:+ start:289 stop:501 length:213 start_codon:yes stop_codon:yes gene_type:complete